MLEDFQDGTAPGQGTVISLRFSLGPPSIVLDGMLSLKTLQASLKFSLLKIEVPGDYLSGSLKSESNGGLASADMVRTS